MKFLTLVATFAIGTACGAVAIAGKPCTLNPEKYSKEGSEAEKKFLAQHLANQSSASEIANNVEIFRVTVQNFVNGAKEICSRKQTESDYAEMVIHDEAEALKKKGAKENGACAPYRTTAHNYRYGNAAAQNSMKASRDIWAKIQSKTTKAGVYSMDNLARLERESPLAKTYPDQAKSLAEKLRPEVRKAYLQGSVFDRWLEDFDKEVQANKSTADEAAANMKAAAQRLDVCSSTEE